MAIPPGPLASLPNTSSKSAGTIVLAFAYAVALLAIGAATMALGEVAHWTALIPAMLGAIVLLAAVGGRLGGLGERAVGGIVLALSILALSGTLSALPLLPAVLTGDDGVRNAAAVLARSVTAAASLLYVAAMTALIVRRVRARRAPA